MIKRVLSLAISLGFWTIDTSARRLQSVLGKRRPGTCTVLYYHVVTDQQRERFAGQMDMLLKLARPISLEGPIALEPGKHHVAVTFDDAFRESLRNALPELEKRDIPATLSLSPFFTK